MPYLLNHHLWGYSFQVGTWEHTPQTTAVSNTLVVGPVIRLLQTGLSRPQVCRELGWEPVSDQM